MQSNYLDENNDMLISEHKMLFLTTNYEDKVEINVIDFYNLNYDYTQFCKCLKRTHPCYINLTKKIK